MNEPVRMVRILRRRLVYVLALAGVTLFVSSCGIGQPNDPDIGSVANLLTFDVTRTADTYTATSRTTSSTYTGTLKTVVERAIGDLTDGGSIVFGTGEFDLGSDYFKLYDAYNVTFVGQGIDNTVIRNRSDLARDTEPFNMTRANYVTIRDLTVIAEGSIRTTSDAIDFDAGNNVLIERVRVAASRGKGIVFDGKGDDDTADGNVVRDCVVEFVPNDGIQLLASSGNLVEGCVIRDVGGTGIYANKASSQADQANKPSNENVISGNTITNAGRDGIRINSGSFNVVTGNTILNSSDDVNGLDGIRIVSYDGVACNDNVIENNVATDDQETKTQRYGLKILSANCNRTVVRANDFTGNRSGEIYDLGTNTIYDDGSVDTEAPSIPTGVSAVATDAYEVLVTWTESVDNVGVVGYEIARDGITVASIGVATSFRDGSVEATTEYAYGVRARDAAGNWSAYSDPTWVTTPAPDVLTISPTSDTYVTESSPTRNFGSDRRIQVDGRPGKITLIAFDVTEVGGRSIESAVIRLHNLNYSSEGGRVFELAPASWGEHTVTWNTMPERVGSEIADLGRVTPGNWYDVDVSAVIHGDGSFAFAIVSDHADGAYYGAKEGDASLAPELVIAIAAP